MNLRGIVNAYRRHLGGLMGDAFDMMRGFLEILVWIFAFVAFAAIVVGGIFVIIARDRSHGSCETQHWEGKILVCDRYYPPPVTR